MLTTCLIGAVVLVSAAGAEQTAPVWKYSRAMFEPFWRTDTMREESVLFTKDGDGSPHAPLLFEPTRIVSVRSASGLTTYRGGRDYIWKPGTREIELPTRSRIVFKTPKDLRRPLGSQPYALTSRDGSGDILFGAGHEYHDMQTVVTYVHKPDVWQGPKPALAADQIPRTLAALRAAKPLKIALLGDSISTGCNASGWAGTAPFQPAWQDLLVMHLEAVYKSKISLTNAAVGGTDTEWGRDNIGKIVEAKPDLVILAFGMNDSGGRPAPIYASNIQAMIDAVRRADADTEFVLVATMVGNKDWVALRQELFPEYRDALAKLCGPGIALADVTGVWAELLKQKRDVDMTGNGVNHPNDFGHRVYAQVLSALLVPEERHR